MFWYSIVDITFKLFYMRNRFFSEICFYLNRSNMLKNQSLILTALELVNTGFLLHIYGILIIFFYFSLFFIIVINLLVFFLHFTQKIQIYFFIQLDTVVSKSLAVLSIYNDMINSLKTSLSLVEMPTRYKLALIMCYTK